MTDCAFSEQFYKLSALQDALANFVIPHYAGDLSRLKLCGDTALSRFHLRHRLSYDLDFFVSSEGFDAEVLAKSVAQLTNVQNLEFTHDGVKADQVHLTIAIDGVPMKISFIEDIYATEYPAILSNLFVGNVAIRTESLDGLYHRKLRTVVGSALPAAEKPFGGRQTARDMFDLYVLLKTYKPLLQMIKEVAYPFPTTAFEDGMANMAWFSLADEFAATVTASKWQDALNVDVVRDHLHAEIGMTELSDWDGEENNSESRNSEKN
jgi:hypothetical protein